MSRVTKLQKQHRRESEARRRRRRLNRAKSRRTRKHGPLRPLMWSWGLCVGRWP